VSQLHIPMAAILLHYWHPLVCRVAVDIWIFHHGKHTSATAPPCVVVDTRIDGAVQQSVN